MNEPLASAAGNAVEIRNAVDYLTGAKRDPRLHRVTLALGAELLALSGLADDVEGGRAALQRALDSGAAAERFERMVSGARRPEGFSEACSRRVCRARRFSSTPCRSDAASWPRSTCEPSGSPWSSSAADGRGPSDTIDPSVGFTGLAPIGAEVGPDAPLAQIHARSPEEAEAAARRLRAAYSLSAAPPALADPVIARIAGAA